jgi:acetyl esterase/lipase
MFKKFLSFIAVLILSACSEAKFAVVNAPSVTYSGQIINNIAYGDNERQKLDIYIPNIDVKSLPVIVFFHGGRWSFGSKDQYKFVGMTLSQQGYIVVMPNTRLYPEVKHPTFVEDGAKATAWVHENIAEYGGNDDLYLSGHSSGAHIAALITANENYLEKFDLSTDIINAFAGISGPYDFVPEEPDLKDMFGPPSDYHEMQLTTYINGDEPPMLLLYTEEDETVHIRNLELLRDKINEEGGQVETIIYPKGDHIDAVGALSWINPANLSIAEDIDRFFKHHQ